MSLRTWCNGLIVCLLLTGCAFMQPRVQKAANKLECDGSKECTVAVNVDCTRYGECGLSVDYDVIVAVGRNRPLDIGWTLTGEGRAEFAGNGIAIDNSAFECRAEGNRRFSCRDKHPDFGVFKYAINVTVKESPFGPRGVQSLDPWIVND